MRWAYYNENDGFAAEWLRNLIREGHIAPGEVDARDIREVRGDDLRDFQQCHFFAGIGVWSYALRRANWFDDRPVWTGSCPCQPFSAAGKRQGDADERHLWPVWFRLIRECRPAIIFGEQVASKDALRWLDAVSDDLEGEDYAVGAADLCAPGVGAPHIRQRLFWLADSSVSGRDELAQRDGGADGRPTEEPGRLCASGRLADSSGQPGLEVERQQPARGECAPAERGGEAIRLGDAERISAWGDTGAGARAEGRAILRPVRDDARPSGAVGWMGNTQDHHGRLAEGCERGGVPQPVGAGEAFGLGEPAGGGCERQRNQPEHGVAMPAGAQAGAGPGWASPLDGFWADADWLRCTDGSWRPVEPGAFPLAHGVAGRVGRLRAYGNAIVAPLATEFIRAAREACREVRL